MDATLRRTYTFTVSIGERTVRVGSKSKHQKTGHQKTRHQKTRHLWRRGRRLVKHLTPARLTPQSWEGRLLALAWALAALITLTFALSQSLPMFLLAFAAVTSGSYAALWLMNGAPGSRR